MLTAVLTIIQIKATFLRLALISIKIDIESPPFLVSIFVTYQQIRLTTKGKTNFHELTNHVFSR